MTEFNNRVDAQRSILGVVNSRLQVEELCGLSKKALERWAGINNVDLNSEKYQLLTTISDKLFFLANKSQEQVSDEYRIASAEIFQLKDKLCSLLEHDGR